MANNETLGASFAIDVTNLKAGLAQANRLIRESQSEFQAAAAGMDDWTASEDGLTAKIKSLNQIADVQRKKVDALQEEYDRLVADGLDPTSRAAVELRTKINSETAALNKSETEIRKQTKALAELADGTEDASDATDDAEKSFDGLKGAAGAAVGAIAAVGAACVAAVGSFLGLAESTRESRNEMAKLETSFQTAKLSAENAEKTFTELYGIMGDEGAAVEAAQHLSKISKDEADLAANTRILTGVMAQYGTSIPTEGLAEGMAATAAMGEVQGVLADALEWQGVNLEEYNAKLATLATEEERAAYIQSTLTDIYGASADAYRENNAEIIASNEAQASLNDTLNELGAIAEPIMTKIKTLAADLLTSITPFVSLMGEGLAGALNGTAGAADMLAEGLNGIITFALDKIVSLVPFVIETILSLFPTLLSSILAQLPNILQTLLQIVAQTAQGLAGMLPTLIPVVINAVIMLVETLLDNVGMIIDAGIDLILGLADGLIYATPELLAKIPVIIQKLIAAIAANLPKLFLAGGSLLIRLGMGILASIPDLVMHIPNVIDAIISGLNDGITEITAVGGDIVEGLWEGIEDMAGWVSEKIEGFGEDVLGGIKNFFGIASPSRVMADEVGKNLALGIGQGFEKNIGEVNDEIINAMNFDDPRHPNGRPAGGTRGGMTVYQTNNYKQAYTSPKEKYKAKQELYAAARLIKAGAV